MFTIRKFWLVVVIHSIFLIPTVYTLLPTEVIAQITFERTYGGPSADYGNFVQQTSDGGYIITGYTYSFGAGGTDVYLLKTNFLGDTLWTKTYGGTASDVGFSVQQTSEGGYIIVGETFSFGSGAWDVYLIKTDSFGDTRWTRTYGGNDVDVGFSVQQTSEGGYIIAGYTSSFGITRDDVYLLKINPFGDTLWTKAYGGTLNDGGYSVQEISGGGFIIVGFTYSYGAGSYDVYLIKTDSLGDTTWTRTYGGTSGDHGSSIQETSDKGFIIAGFTQSFGAGGLDVYLIKADSFGNTLWTKTYGGIEWDEGRSVHKMSDEGFIIIGYTDSFGTGGDVYLIKTDSLGETLWTRTFGGTNFDEGLSVQETSDGEYILAGWTQSFGAGGSDAYLIKTDSFGDTLWTKTFGGTDNDFSSSVQETSDGGYVIVGWTFSFGAGSADVHLIKTDSIGDTLWTKTYGGIDGDVGWSGQQTSDGGFIVTGVTGSFGSGGGDVYLVKTDSLGNVMAGVEEERSESGVQIAEFGVTQNQPNPFHHSTVIRYQIPLPPLTKGDRGGFKIPVSLAIYDITGRLVETLVHGMQEPGVYQLPIASNQLPGSGIYFYRLTTRFGHNDSSPYTITKKMTLIR